MFGLEAVQFHFLQSLRATVKLVKRQQCEFMQDTTAHEKTQGPLRVSVLSNEAEIPAEKGKKHGQQ